MVRDDLCQALVLSGGGARGAYQAGVLAGIAEKRREDFPFPVITGVSAGAINATALAGHQGDFCASTQALVESWLQLHTNRVFKTSFGSLGWSVLRWLWLLSTGGVGLGVKGIFNTRPLYKFLARHLNFVGIDANIRRGRLDALALSSTCYATGRTITHVQGHDELKMWQRARREAVKDLLRIEHVMASAALPLLFPAIKVKDVFLGDGSIRQSSPLAPAIHLGANRVLSISLRYKQDLSEECIPQIRGYPPPGQVLGMMMHGVFLDSLENDAERLYRTNRILDQLPTGVTLSEPLRHVDLLVLRPSRDLGKMAQGLESHLPLSLQTITRGMGSHQTSSPDLLSYVLFEKPYIERLLELGMRDAYEQWDRIERFLDTGENGD